MAHILTDREKERLSNIPPEQKPFVDSIIGLLPDDLPENPEVGKYYAYREEDSVCADSEPYHGLIKLGKNRTKVLIVIQGGGVSINEYTAARGNSVGGKNGPDTYYVENCFGTGDFTAMLMGLTSNIDINPFKDWTCLFIPYASGDFYAGDGELEYIDLEGNKKICYHHGHKNLFMLVKKLKSLVPHPETLIVTGYSAGGFGTMINSKEIFNMFKDCQTKISFIDSSLIISDKWHDIMKNIWKTKEEIYSVVKTNDMTFDFMSDLKEHHPDAKIMFTCATRDALLAECENFMSYGKMEFTKESGLIFEEHLKSLIDKLKSSIKDNLSFFIFDIPNTEVDTSLNLCQHCISYVPNAFTEKVEGKTFIEWFIDQIDGNLYDIGLALLK